MRGSLKLLLLGVALPGALTPALYATLSSDDPPDAEVLRVDASGVARARADVERARAEVERVRVEVGRIDVEQASAAAVLASRLLGDGSDRCEFGRERTLTLDADAGDLLEVHAGSGSLEIEGMDGLEEVRVTARLCASDAELLEGLDATLDRRGDRVRVGTEYPDRNGWGSSYARADLTLEIPRAMDVEVEDGSGSMSLVRVGAIRIDDGSGGIEVVGADGPVHIDDGSGGIQLQDVGSVDIQDGSGSIDVRDASGGVVLSDGSGSIDVSDVDGDVLVRRDGSGSIDVSEVTGDFVVERDGSGSVRYSRVDGRVDVPDP